jgi:hypothetical protein
VPQVENPALPGWACSRASGRGSSKGGGAPAPWTRETADEAEATLKTRVAAEAEAGEIRAHALPTREGKGSVNLPVQGGRGEREMDDISRMTEEAMKRLRELLKPEELKIYETYYENFKTAASEDVRYTNAYRIQRKFLEVTGVWR